MFLPVVAGTPDASIVLISTAQLVPLVGVVDLAELNEERVVRREAGERVDRVAREHGKIDALGLRRLVDAVIVSADLGIKKPDQRIFHAAAVATDSTLDGSWMVGDSPTHDIVGGAQCGARTAWLHRGRTWTETVTEPTITVSTLEELAPAILAAGE